MRTGRARSPGREQHGPRSRPRCSTPRSASSRCTPIRYPTSSPSRLATAPERSFCRPERLDLRAEVDVGRKTRLGLAVARVALLEESCRAVEMVFGKGLNCQLRHRRRTIPLPCAENAHWCRAAARRRPGPRLRALPRRREQPRLPRLLRAARGAGDERRHVHERAARLHEHALQAPRRLQAEGRRRRLGHAPGAPRRGLGGLQVRAPADAGSPARAVPALPADRRGVRLSEPRVRGLGGGRRDRHARDAGRRSRDQDDRRLDRPRRVPARLGERRADDDPARSLGRERLHARAGRGALRHPARPDPGLHRAQGRHVGQHPGHPRDRRQDGRAADLAVRLGRRGDRARGGALARAQAEHHRARGPGDGSRRSWRRCAATSSSTAT